MNPAAASASRKTMHPELYCKNSRCLYRGAGCAKHCQTCGALVQECQCNAPGAAERAARHAELIASGRMVAR